MKKLFLLCLLAVALLPAGRADEASDRIKQTSGTLTILDGVAGGDQAVRDLAVAAALGNPKLTLTFARRPLAEALRELDAGRADLVLADADELPAAYRLRRRYAREVALVLVNAANPRAQFSSGELRNIFNNTLGNWKTLNGGSYTLHRYAVPANAPGEAVFRRKIMGDTRYAPEIYRRAQVDEILLLTAANPNAIALTGYPAGELTTQVKAAAVDGVEPTIENLKNGKYPLTADRVAVFSRRISPQALAFIQLLYSRDFSDTLPDHALFDPAR